MSTQKRTATRTSGVYKRTGKRGTKYDVVYRDPTGKQRTKTCDTYEEARGFKSRNEASILAGEYVDPSRRARKVTVEQAARKYLASRYQQRDVTARKQRQMIDKHMAGTTLGQMPLAAVTSADIDAWLTERARLLARSTLRAHAGLLRATLNYAVRNRDLARAPEFDLPAIESADEDQAERMHPPTAEQVRALAAAMPHPSMSAMVTTQYGLGLRLGELLALRQCDVALEFRRVKIAGQMSRTTGERGPLKTKHSRRTVPMPELVAGVLRDFVRDDADPESLIFPNPRTGRAWKHRRYSEAFAKAVGAAGLPTETVTHDLRHAAATTWLRAGLSPVAVGRLLGHKDGVLVLKVYGHYLPEDNDLAVAALDTAWSGEHPTPTLRAVT